MSKFSASPSNLSLDSSHIILLGHTNSLETCYLESDFRCAKLNDLISLVESCLCWQSVEEVLAHRSVIEGYNHIYIVVLSDNYKLMLSILSELCKILDICESKCTELVVLEDLMLCERPYIYTNRERNFLKMCQTLTEGLGNLRVEVSSSNFVLNSWGEGDTRIVSMPELLEDVENVFWRRILDEVEFHHMYNQGNPVPRLVAIQSIYDPTVRGRPLYRHPNDEEPPNEEAVPVVRELMRLVEARTGVTGLNHALIQQYRDGSDNIAAHSDKTLDIHLGTPIINLSFGAPRRMSLQLKRNKARLEKVPLCHGQCVVFGLRSNQLWWHEVPKDVTMSSLEPYGKARISFTFRRIGTFVTDEGCIVGQGSPYKTLEDARAGGAGVGVAGIVQAEESTAADTSLSENMAVATATGTELTPSLHPLAQQSRADLIKAFSAENRQAEEFNWQAVYGGGFLVKP